MKILFLNSLADTSRGSGAEQVLMQQISGLEALGHTCTLLATSPSGRLHRTQSGGVVTWLSGPGNTYWPHDGAPRGALSRMLWHGIDSYNPIMRRAVHTVALREKPDLACVHNLSGLSVAAWSALTRLHIPIVQVLHDYYLICPKATMFRDGRNCAAQCVGCRMLRLPHRALSRHLSAVVGVSQHVLDAHTALGYFDGVVRRLVIHNARDFGASAAPTRSADATGKALRFGYIGRLDPAKGLDCLLTEFAAAALPDAQLWIAGRGRGEYEALLRQRAASMAGVRLLGHVPAESFYQQVDVVVVPSLWNEPLGGVVFEAMSHGIPVIASKRGGIPEMVHHESNGLLIEPHEQGQIAGAMRRLASEPGLREAMRARTKATARPYLDVARWARLYAELFEDVMRQPGPLSHIGQTP